MKPSDYPNRATFLKAWQEERLKSNAKLDYHMYRFNLNLLDRMQRSYTAFSEKEIDEVRKRIQDYKQS